jgi:D-alanyl-D-alanine carboxypeptidase
MALVLPVLLLAACGPSGYGPGGRVEYGADGWKMFAPTRYYPPPGPPGDPWGPYVQEAAARYRVPEQWVRAVMKQESGGQEQATSPVGAMGLMQVMPATYEELRSRHRLGEDPYDPHNNILAGTAYIREMYDRYGAPGFLAAYNAGPDRVDNYLAGKSGLPDETVNYLAAVTPNLGSGVPRSGPFAVYASARSGRGSRVAPTIASLAAGCDLNAAYNPNHPCTTLEQAARQPTPVQTAAAPQLGTNGCDLNAAFDPNNPCSALIEVAASPPPPARAELYRPSGPAVQLASAGRSVPLPREMARPIPTPTAASRQPAAPPRHSPSRPPEPHGDWAIQVGAFANQGLARAVAESARAQAPDQLRSASLALLPTAPFGGKVLYRARLARLSANAAANACTRLNHHQLPCVVVPPNRS